MKKYLTPFLICVFMVTTQESMAAEPALGTESLHQYAPILKTFHKNLTDTFTILEDLPINGSEIYLSADKQTELLNLNQTLATSLPTLDQCPINLRAHIITDLNNLNYFMKSTTNLNHDIEELLTPYNILKARTDLRPIDHYHSNISYMKILTNELIGKTTSTDSRRYRLNPEITGFAALKCGTKALRYAPNKERLIYAGMNCIDLAWIIPLKEKDNNPYAPLSHSPYITTVNTRNNLIADLNKDLAQEQRPYQSAPLSLFERNVAQMLVTNPTVVKKEAIFSAQTLISTLYDCEICNEYDHVLTKLENNAL